MGDVVHMQGGVIVKALEDALDLARSGKMRAVVVVADCEGGEPFNAFAYRQGWASVPLVGMLTMITHRIVEEEWRAIEDEEDESDEDDE